MRKSSLSPFYPVPFLSQFKYDPFDRRIVKIINGVAHDYLYDGSDIALEYINGALENQYVHGAGVDEHLGVVQNGRPYYYLTDGLGSVTRVTDQSGNVVQSYSYSGFGKVTAGNPTFVQPYSFTGREYDEETELHYYRARYYDPEIGRFIRGKKRGQATFLGLK